MPKHEFKAAQSALEYKYCAETDTQIIEGYASRFGVSDQSGDVVERGAFTASIADGGRGVKMLWQHKETQPIGVWDVVREDACGLFVRGRILNDVEAGREAAALLSAGAIDGLSIGFKVKRASKAAKGRILHEIELWEVSLVTFPMLAEARAKARVNSGANEQAAPSHSNHFPTQRKRETMTHIETQRPMLSGASQFDDLHVKAMDSYLRRGDEAELRDVALEGKSLTSSINSDGGFLVDPQTAASIQSVLQNTVSLRAVANVVQIEASSFDVLVDNGDLEAGWANEDAARAETATGSFDRITIPLHELSAMPKSSQRLLDDAAFDVEAWLAGRIADKFSRSEGAAFISGDGVDKPRGVLSHPVLANDSWSWGSVGMVKTEVDGDFDQTKPADAIVDLVYALPARYRQNASFVMNSKTAGAVRKMKDADGRFLWSDSVTTAESARLMGYPVLISEDMPDIATGAHGVLFGDFQAGYTIAERPDLRILRDPFSAKPHVLFYATKRVGGDVSDFAAIKALEFSA